MRHLRLLFLACLAALLLLVQSSVATAGPRVTFELTDGSLKEATEVVSVDERAADPAFTIVVAGKTEVLPLARIKPPSVYEAWSQLLSNDDPAGHIALGIYCDEKGLKEEAVRELTLAREISARMERRAGDLLATARLGAAAQIFAAAEQQAALGLDVEALTLYTRVWSYYPDADSNLRDKARDAIRTLCAKTGLKPEKYLDNVIQLPGNPGGANPNPGGPGPNPGPGPGVQPNPGPPTPLDQLDDSSEWRSGQVRDRKTLQKVIESARAAADRGYAILNLARQSEAASRDNDAAKQFEQAESLLVDALNVLMPAIRDMVREQWADWMPNICREAQATRAQIEIELLRLAKARMHYFARRANDDKGRLDAAAKWVARVLALDPSDPEGIKVRMLLTEIATRNR
ncbi:MAG: hypothetical protein AB7K09_06885 [Planctomycetota bacterium]